MDQDSETPPPYGPSAPITLKAVMESKEVGSIIGRKGEIVTRFREESGARINISSDATCAERLVTVTGTADAVSNAYQLILVKLEEYHIQAVVSFLLAGQRMPLTMRLVIPAVQCGTLLSGNGQRLKDVREATGAILQMSGYFLPHSTDRALIISGLRESIAAAIKLICDMFFEVPPKNEHLQMALHGIPLAPVLAPAAVVSYNAHQPFRMPLSMTEGCPQLSAQNLTFLTPHPPFQFLHVPPAFERFEPVVKTNPFAPAIFGGNVSDITKFGMQQLTNIANPNTTPLPIPFINPGFPMLQAFPNLRVPPAPASQPSLTHKITVSNELIGCIIGKEGKKIAEIRDASGALIHISNLEDAEAGNSQERIITINGGTHNVNLARYLIEMRLEEQRQMIEAAAESMALGYPSTSHAAATAPPALQCVQLVANAPPYNNFVRVNVQDYLSMSAIANQTAQVSHAPQ